MFGFGKGKLPSKMKLRQEIIKLTRDVSKGVPGAAKKLKQAREQYDQIKL